MTIQNELKQLVAKSAIQHIKDDNIVGIGSGSTVSYFIAELANIKHRIGGTVSSSNQSSQLLKQYGIEVFDLNSLNNVDVYIDGADEIDNHLRMIKGGGAALTREKIIATVASKFICIADESKLVDVLGNFPLPIEVIPMARSYVARQLVTLGGTPVWRENCVTDNGNWIIDVHNLTITNPLELEIKLNNITGIVSNGIFAQRKADMLLLGHSNGTVATYTNN